MSDTTAPRMFYLCSSGSIGHMVVFTWCKVTLPDACFLKSYSYFSCHMGNWWGLGRWECSVEKDKYIATGLINCVLNENEKDDWFHSGI